MILAILLNEICERYTFYSIKSLLLFYIETIHGYTSSDSKLVYHLFLVFCYLTPIAGATIADSYWGKYKTILYLSCVYTVGVFLTVLGAIPGFGSMATIFMIFGLIFIAIGMGGIKPCISSFGADQYEGDPRAEEKRTYFFTMFYIIINIGSLISSTFAPILRTKDEVCNKVDFLKNKSNPPVKDSCYSLAFFIPLCMLVMSVIFFVSKQKLYYKKEPSGDNILFKFCSLLRHAWFSKKNDKDDHWLDTGIPKFGKKFVTEIKLALNIMLVLFPLCAFWFIFDQKGSRWMIQASQMKCYFDFPIFGKKHFLPEQVLSLNPLFIVGFSPVIKFYIIPALEKVTKTTFTPFGIIASGITLVGFSQLSIALFEITVSQEVGQLPGPGLVFHQKYRVSISIS